MQLNAEKRTQLGKKAKKLRRNRILPGVIFGKGLESVSIAIPYNDFVRVYNEAGETNIVDLKVDGSLHKVLIKEIQPHPVNGAILHANFYEVNLKEKITADIPVELIGEETNELIKSGEAIALQLLNTITIEALPTDLPNSFDVDISNLTEIGAGVSIEDLEFDKEKVTLIGFEDDNANALIVKLDYAVSEEEEDEELTEEELLAEMEVTGEVDEEDEDSEKSSGDSKSEE